MISGPKVDPGRKENREENSVIPSGETADAAPVANNPTTPVRSGANVSRKFEETFRTPSVTSTPISNETTNVGSPKNDSSVYETPPRQLTGLPRSFSSSNQSPVIHPELRAYNKPGIKEVPVDVSAPRMTRSGRMLGS